MSDGVYAPAMPAPGPVPLDRGALAVLREIADPLVFDLGAPIGEAMPQFSDARRFERSWVTPPSPVRSGEVTFAVESVEASLHTSTHIDAPVHVQYDGLIHGGEPVATAAAEGFFQRGGVETLALMVVPFVLLDVARAAGVEALPDDAEIGSAELERALHDGLSIEPGTAVLVRSGKMRSFGTGDAHLAEQPGLTLDGAQWLLDRQVATIGSDTAGTEPMPARDSVGPVHKLVLFERGIPLVENLVLDELAAHGHTRGVFVCLPLKLVGATGSWVRPIAIA